MDNNNWGAAQGQQVEMPGVNVKGGDAVAAMGMDGVDWRTRLQPDSRQRIVSKIMETLKRHLPFAGQEGLQKLKNIAVKFEEKIYAAATSQQDYLRKISLKMLMMETKYQNDMVNSLQSTAASNSKNPLDPASQNMQSQIQNSANLTSIGGMSSVPDMQNMSNGTPNAVGISNIMQADQLQPSQQAVMQPCLGQTSASSTPPQNQQSSSLQQSTQSTDMQQQTTTDQQKQLLQSQGVIPEVPPNSSSRTGSASGGDWQEEIYQKIKSMNEMYFAELNEMYQRMAAKLQQHDALPQQPKNELIEKLRFYKVMLERLIMFLRTNKNEIMPNHKEKIAGVEKKIVNLLSLRRPRKQQLAQPQMHANEGQTNGQMQPMNVQSSVVTEQQNNMTNVPHIDSGQGMNQIQNPAQQMNINPMQSNANNPSQANSNILQPQQIKQELQMFSNQHLEQQYQQWQMQQQYMHKQQLIQQQQIYQQHMQIQELIQQQQQQMHQQYTKVGTLLQPANSNAGNVVHPKYTEASMPHQSIAIGTPGKSASPLLAEFTSPDDGVVSFILYTCLLGALLLLLITFAHGWIKC